MAYSHASESQSMKPRVFLSSVFKDTFDGEFRRIPVRDRIIANAETLPVELWAYELFWKDGEDNADADTIVDRCFRGIKECDLFVYLQTHRHGSGVEFGGGSAVIASYLELELLAAALLQKPTLVLHLIDQEPHPLLQDALRCFRTKTSGLYYLADENTLYERFLSATRALAGDVLAVNPHAREFVDWLSGCRTQSSFTEDVETPRLHFLDGETALSSRTADLDRVKELLTRVADGTYIVDGMKKTLPHGAAMFRLWAAMRELLGSDKRGRCDPAAAMLWDRCLGIWAGKASWFGLHGHAWMGPLAAVNSQAEIRRAFAGEPEFRSSTDVREPVGARASAIYSIAGRMSRRERKIYHYREAIELATRLVAEGGDSEAGALSIRGHSAMRLAENGQVWWLWRAESDFRRSLALRERKAANSPSVGEAMVDLGFWRCAAWRRASGLRQMQDGIALLRTAGGADGRAILVRGLRKLEQAAIIAERRDLAAQVREETKQLAREIEAFDQLRGPRSRDRANE